jgi:endoglucanase
MSEHNVKTVVPFALLSVALVVYLAVLPHITHADGASVNVWWPTNGAHVTGTQPLKAMVPGMDVSSYDMYWQVDGGQWNKMSNNYTDYQHKQADISVAGWNWRGNGPYTVNYIVSQNGNTIAQQPTQIYVDNGQVSTPTVQVSPIQVQVQSASASVTPAPAPTSNNLSNFFVNPNSSAAANGLQALASQPTATWFGNWNSNIQNDVHSLVTKAQAANAVPVLVAYNIPARDCGGYSAGGSNSASGYASWISAFAQGIGQAPAVVVLEPDALTSTDCLSQNDQNARMQMLSQAVQTLKQNGNTRVYIDAGHSNWVDPQTMAGRLVAAGVEKADGFALNVSNFMPTSNETAYGTQISSKLQSLTGKSKHFVIDTSRNGNGSNGEWCNPSGRAIGIKPTSNTGNTLVDAYLWLKTPGESDGNCNGGPSAGTWWQSYAQGLVQNAH